VASSLVLVVCAGDKPAVDTPEAGQYQPLKGWICPLHGPKLLRILRPAGLAVSLGLGSLVAQTDQQTPAPNTQSMNMMNMSPEQCREMMKKMGMSDAMITRCQIMGNAQISAYDPPAVLALRSELKLTDDQVKDLEAIVATAQEQVKTKLTAEQLASLQPIAATPSSMMQMCQSMHSMTGKR
jgi:hypothetical protein